MLRVFGLNLLFLVIAFSLTSCGVVELINVPPIAIAKASPTSGFVPHTVNFDGSESFDPDGFIVSYKWNFGDASSGDGAKVTHTYVKKGVFTAVLIVTDNLGATGTSQVAITVLNPPPTPGFTFSPPNPLTLETVTFDASSSFDLAVYHLKPQSITQYLWDFGDGSTGSGVITTHTYTKGQSYNVTLTVVDDDGASASITKTVQVENRPPTASFTATPSSGTAPLTVGFDASASSDLDGTIVSYQWNFGDGASGEGVTIQHTYTAAGNFTATLVVTDDLGTQGSSQQIIAVGRPPRIVSVSPTESAVSTPVTITGNAFGDDPSAVTVTFGGVTAVIDSVQDSQIIARVPVIPTPNGLPTPAPIKVTVSAVESNSVGFQVIRGILFTSAVDGAYQIFIMNPDGSGLTQVTKTGGAMPAWSPDGTRIAFAGSGEGPGMGSEVWIMNADGSGQIQLTSGPESSSWRPAWSPDGTKIAFVSAPLTGGVIKIFIINVDGTNKQELTAGELPAWSPDGTKIAYNSSVNPQIFVINVDGTGQTQLTFTPTGVENFEPAWSSDVSKIVFSRQIPFEGHHIFVMNADGTGQTQLTFASASTENYGTDWSPDGTKIAFISTRSGCRAVFVMNADGTDQKQIGLCASIPALNDSVAWLH